MTSLRNLPYRVICVIGMNDGKYPTPSRPNEFDLIARAKSLRRLRRNRAVD